MNLFGSDINPDIRDTLSVSKEQKSDDVIAVAQLKHRLAQFQRIKRTQYYKAISEVLDPVITHLESQLCKPRGAFPDTPTDILQEQRAEWRGMLHAYKRFRDEPHELEELLRVMEEHKKRGGLDANKKKLDIDKFV